MLTSLADVAEIADVMFSQRNITPIMPNLSDVLVE